MRRHVPSRRLLDMLREHKPEKQQLTVLTKGILPTERLYGHVLNVRIFPKNHDVVQHLQSECLSMNTTSNSNVMFVHGIHNDTFACLFLSNDNLEPSTLNQVLGEFLMPKERE